mmetsp:Transcript_21912/g.32572  ORF Transcript_21912/g.32572 Transcript_21912/m.32572 type:complete len:772 (+) Transcript_21912:36-2351(+)
MQKVFLFVLLLIFCSFCFALDYDVAQTTFEEEDRLSIIRLIGKSGGIFANHYQQQEKEENDLLERSLFALVTLDYFESEEKVRGAGYQPSIFSSGIGIQGLPEPSEICQRITQLRETVQTTKALFYFVEVSIGVCHGVGLTEQHLTLLNSVFEQPDTASFDDLYAASACFVRLRQQRKLSYQQVKRENAYNTLRELIERMDEDDSTFDGGAASKTGMVWQLFAAYLTVTNGLSGDNNLAVANEMVGGSVADIFAWAHYNADDATPVFVDHDAGSTQLYASAAVIAGLSALLDSEHAAQIPLVRPSDEALLNLCTLFVHNKNANQLRDVFAAVQGIYTCASHLPGLRPPVLQLHTSSVVAGSLAPNVKFTLTDFFGQFLTDATLTLSSLRQHIPSNGKQKASTKLIASDVNMLSSGSSATRTSSSSSSAKSKSNEHATQYQFNLLKYNPEAGQYSMRITAQTNDQDVPDLDTIKFITKVVQPVRISNFLVEAFKTSAQSSKQLAKGGSYELDADAQQTLTQPLDIHQDEMNLLKVQFQLESAIPSTTSPPQLHQVLLRLRSTTAPLVPASDREQSRRSHEGFVLCTPLSKGRITHYTCQFNAKKDPALLLYRSGDYSLTLLLGDPFIDQFTEWTFAESVSVEFTKKAPSTFRARKNIYHAQPEITHMFRESERRPPFIISLAASAGVAAPLLVLVFGVFQYGLSTLNFRGNKFIGLLFQFTLIAIAAVLALYWLALNMFQTLGILSILTIISTILGSRALRSNYQGRMNISK